MERTCPDCGHRYDTQAAPGLEDACPKCLAGALQATGSVPKDPAAPAPAPAGGVVEDEPFPPGTRLRDLEVLGVLGRGGMGVVYKARQTGLDRIVALKVIAPRLAAVPEFAQRFGREARALAALNHPNIVHVYDFGQEDGRWFLAMEFVDGVPLREIIQSGPLQPATALRYIPQICDALEYAHGMGVVHRDIKPGNILVDRRGNLKIADFGLAKMTAAAGDAHSLSVTGARMGTPNYMAPEQWEGAKAVDHRADIFSLGVVFYEMLTGELPLGRFPPPSRKVAVDVRCDEVVLKALEKDPELRYQRAGDVKRDVTGLGDGMAVQATTAAPVAAAIPPVAQVAPVAPPPRQEPGKPAIRKDTGMLIPAGILLGLGVGFLTDDTGSCLMLGLGTAFLARFLCSWNSTDRPDFHLIPAGIFLGLGCGLLLDHTATGIVIGLGTAFLLKFLLIRRRAD